MRILVVSDLHYTLRQLDWVTERAGDYDLVVVAGDLLDVASSVAPDAQIAVALEYLTRMARATTVVACSGNHDLTARNELDERAAPWLDAARGAGVFVDGARIDTDDVLITVCPWWDGPRTRAVVDRQLAEDAERVAGRRWVWVYHSPPGDSPTSWTGSRYYADDDLTAWIARHRPDIVLCGHVHESPFVPGGGWFDRIGTTAVFNAGRQRGPVPTCIELDTVLGTARWSSMEGSDELSLTGAEPT
jgi:Icc-related predicted phosphoesterase